MIGFPVPGKQTAELVLRDVGVVIARSMSKIASMRRTASTASGEMTGAFLRRFMICAATSASSKK